MLAQARASRYPNPRLVAVAGVAFAAVFAGYVTFLTNTASYREWAGPPIALVLVLVSLPVLSRQARRENDPRLFWLLFAALVLKLLAAIVRHFLTFEVYGAADAVVYNRTGTLLAEGFRAGVFSTEGHLDSLTSTDFIKLATGIIYTITGPTTWGGFLIYSWLAFWGAFLMYRAFVIAVPEGATRVYARLLFFLPSMLYWPASIGKEAWLMFALGVAVFGCAKILSGRMRGGVLPLAAGLWATWVVRPHLAGFVGIALVAGILVRRPASGSRELAPVVRIASLAAVGVLAVALATQATTFLQEAGIDTEGGLSGTLSQVSERTGEGDSTFTPPSLTSPTGLPLAVLTVLFRPFVFEAHNAQAMVIALEGMFIAGLGLVRARWIVAAMKSMRRQAYVVFALAYVLVSIVGMSSFANFGLLARQRTLLMPLFLVLLAVRPPSAPPSAERPVPVDAG